MAILALMGLPVTASATVMPETITTNTTLSPASGTYTGRAVFVSEGVTLSIEPGTVLKLSDALVVEGEIQVNGTKEAPVIFTSSSDDSYGGDTNEDGSVTKPAPGDWGGVFFKGTAEGSLTYARIHYGGRTGFYAAVGFKCPCADPPNLSHTVIDMSSTSGVSIEKGSPSITDSDISHNAEGGVNLTSSGSEIHGNSISHNHWGVYEAIGWEAHGAVDIENNQIEENDEYGIWVSAPTGYNFIDSASIGNNTISGNGERAVVYDAFANSSEIPGYANNMVPTNITSNTVTENGQNGIWVGGLLGESSSWQADYPLVLFGNGVTIAKNATLAIEKGSVIKGQNGMLIRGNLTVNGTLEDPVTFTSALDDEVGGDTNGDGGATKAGPGTWPGLRFEGGGEFGASILTHARVLFGGHESSGIPMVTVHCPCIESPEFIESSFEYSATEGIRLEGGGTIIEGSTVANNAYGGISAVSGTPEIHGSTVSDNQWGISHSILSGTHGSVSIDDNLVENNEEFGIWVSAPTSSNFIDSTSLGGNTVVNNGERAIVYEAFANMSENPELAENEVPDNITSNGLAGNQKNAIWISGVVDSPVEWDASGYPLVPFSSGVFIAGGGSLTIEPGSMIKSEHGLSVNGTLTADGTAEEPITFTSYRDDSIGGDTNGDGELTEPNLGDWGGIQYFSALEADLSYLDMRYAETAFDLKFLDAMRISNSDFVYNKEAFKVAETGNNNPALSALSCVPPYLSFVISENNWYGKYGLPGPAIDILSTIGATLPEGYKSLFEADVTAAEMTASYYGSDNTIPFTIYSCPALGIPPVPTTPVHLVGIPLKPHFPDPEV